MSEIDLSVIVPVYNAGPLIDRCLDSVFSQSGQRSVEVILIDDGSTDDSVARIEARSEQSCITLLQQKNSGPSAARNRGIETARGRFIAFLDADDYWLDGFVDATVGFLERHSDAIAVSVAQRHLTTSGTHEAPAGWRDDQSVMGMDGAVLDDFFGFWAERRHVCTGSITIRTEIAKATGGMRRDLRLCEDLEFWALLATYGAVGYIPQLLFVSDGSKVTKEIGWVEKHMPRWRNAVSLEEWQQRLEGRISPEARESFNRTAGRVGRDLAYSILMSKRYALAHREIRLHGGIYPDDKMSRLLRLAACNPLNWLVISRALVYREYHRR